MSAVTYAELFPEVPPDRPARCCNCGRDTTAPVTVGYVPSASGPGYGRVACPDCAPKVAPMPEPYRPTLT
ncbi:hypothetical protein [Streptomyces sp. NPDC037389]|uniref:hypothetical protein n=1 Tax=Streptomyces sp. NPDC037389 TaxID=3155369 RepID=UPI0034008D6D